jgi:RNA polymerase sigma factor (sigma-70 family)
VNRVSTISIMSRLEPLFLYGEGGEIVMSDEELVALIKAGIDVRDNMERLYDQKKGYIRYFAKRYFGVADEEDLMQEGFIALSDAVSSYDHEKYEIFANYLKFYLIRQYDKYTKKYNRKGSISRYDNERINRYIKITKAFKSEYGREPTIPEYVAYLDTTVEQVNQIKIMINTRDIVSVDNMVDDESGESFIDTVLTDGQNMEESIVDGMIEASLKSGLWEIVKQNTTPNEYDVVRAVYTLNMTPRSYSTEAGASPKTIQADYNRAMGKLRTDRIKRIIAKKFELDYNGAYRSGVARFKHTWTSSTERVAINNLERELSYITRVLTSTVSGINLLTQGQINLAVDNGILDDKFEIHAEFEKPKRGKEPQPVYQYGLDGTFIRQWDSALEASRELKIDESSIRKCCNGKLAAYKGYQWRLDHDGK